MKKTVSINLNSFMYNIDEDAYQILSDYLGQLKSHFSNQAEGEEIIRDIEARMAEIFNMKIGPNKQVITIEDVQEVIGILGDIGDITGETEEDQKRTGKSSEEDKTDKKLYRNTDESMIGGVCAGLSEYTGISTMAWRIIFLVLLFAGQIGLIAYIILWIVVPEAKTTAQKIEMKGGKINLSNIEKRVKQEYEEVKKNFDRKENNKFAEFFENLGKAILSVIEVIGTILAKAFGVVFLLIGAALITAITIGLLQVNDSELVHSGNLIQMVWLPGLLEFITTPDTAWFMSLCVFFVVLIPIIAIIHWGVVLLFDVKSHKSIGTGLFIAWLMAILFTVAGGIHLGLGFKEEEEKSQTLIIPAGTENTYYLKVNPDYADFRYPSDKDIDDLEELELFLGEHFILNDGERLQMLTDIDIEYTNDSSAVMEVIYQSRGKSNAVARENLEKIVYRYRNDTAMVELSPYFQIEGRKYAGQEVKVDVRLPRGSKLVVDPALQELVDRW